MVEIVVKKKRNVAVDFVKFIATLLVLNSHMGICYGPYSVLATGGGIGDALFFFISGFTLFMGKKMDCVNWYKRRINRIYPTILAMGVVATLIFSKEQGFLDVITSADYWFLRCILVCYLLLYPIIRYGWNLKVCTSISIILVLVAYFFVYDFQGQMFYGVDNYFRWIFYFVIMLLGGGTYLKDTKIIYKKRHIPLMIICVIAWYGINYWAKNDSDFAIVSMLPLIGVCYFVYAIGKAPWIERLFDSKIWGNILFIIGSLCLESYMIQKYIFTDALNHIFPLNIPIIMLLVLISAYILHVLAGVIGQVFDSKQFDWKTLFLYKV